ncbi:MAG TPA: protein kinase [Vicinamibacterales bacterium]|nr:protein kinase [Vicinamibacterales bacterium]
MPLVPGTRLGSYEVTAVLGAGGMGEVYRARDTRLARAVALKMLPADMARDPERLARFQREARAVAALNHPHIVTIYSVEEADGIHFLTMELVEGQSLDRIIPERGLSVDRILSIGTALAEALAAAHEKGIVHRDLKPANVMMSTNGRLKVLDFGLAKEMRAADPADATVTAAGQTQAGVVMGTPAYMSPEQVTGRDVDHRTDIFSLGILLYETASGRRPFEGSTSIELASAILRDTPRPLSDVRSDVPADLARLIERCLEKDPRRRVQTARDVGNELGEIGRLATPTGAARPIAIDHSSAARADEGFWVAVLPFKYTGGDADLAALAEGLSEEIVTGLSRFSYLRVIARGSTLQYSNTSGDIRAIGKELGARYLMEGSVRQAGSTIRLAVQLVDAMTGAHLWAETYDRQFQPDQIFAMQDELIPRIVSTCADTFGVLARSISDAVRGKDPGQLSPYEALMRGFGYHHRLTPGEHAAAREALEQAVEQAPGNADCWAMLSWIYSHEYGHGFNVRPGSLDRALAAARRAVDAAPSNHLAYQALAVALFFRKDTAGCLSAAERAMALNPLDASNEAIFLITFTGDWERGCKLIRRAMGLNPHHPGWYRLMLAMDEYRKANYRAAVDEAVASNVPGIFWTNVLLAAAHGQLGELEAARHALRDLRAQKEDFAESASEMIGKWFDPKLGEHLIEGLQKAGLTPDASPANSASVRTDEGFWVAVLPFKYRGDNTDLDALGDGLSEEIVTGLSRFSYLRVIARSTTSRYADTAADVRTVGKEIGARYVIEGSLRQAGPKLRIAVQLLDTSSGAHVWAETYDRDFDPDAIFELQDDLVPRIVSTVADWYGVLPHSMSEALRNKRADQLSPYEAVLRSFGYGERRTPEEHAIAQAGLERAVQLAPGYADAWALLSIMHTEEHANRFNPQPDPLGRALAAAQRAADAASSNALAHNALARTRFFRKEFQAFRTAAERTIALNPMDGGTIAAMGVMMAYAGDWEHGCALVERAAQLNPRHPGWYWFPLFYNAYRQRDYPGALSTALKINLPHFFYAHVVIAAVYGQLGKPEAAREALRELLVLRPDFAVTGREDLGKWYPPDLVEQLIDGLRKAGLEVAAG